jgi:large subunit ribosomal protein L21
MDTERGDIPQNYAIVRTGGKQYRVAPGDVFRVESVAGDKGSTIELAEVLLAAASGAVRVGTPLVEGVRVTARILEHGKAKKIIVFKKKRRKGYRRKRGHRQHLTTLQVLEIQG